MNKYLLVLISFAFSSASWAMDVVKEQAKEEKKVLTITKGPHVPTNCIGQDLDFYKKATPEPWFLEVRDPKNIKAVAYWVPRNAWMLWQNKARFNNNSPIIYHYEGYDREDKPLDIMLSYRVSEVTYKDFSKTHIFTGEGEINNKINEEEKKGRGCKVTKPTPLRNTFGNNAHIAEASAEDLFE